MEYNKLHALLNSFHVNGGSVTHACMHTCRESSQVVVRLVKQIKGRGRHSRTLPLDDRICHWCSSSRQDLAGISSGYDAQQWCVFLVCYSYLSRVKLHKHEPSHGLGGLAPYSCMQMHALHGRQGKNNWCKAGRGEISTRTASIIYTVVDRRRFFNTGMLDRRLLLASGTTAHKWRSLACMVAWNMDRSIDLDANAVSCDFKVEDVRCTNRPNAMVAWKDGWAEGEAGS